MPEKKPRSKRWDRQSVRALRKHLGVSQDTLAEELGTRQQTVSEWETGQYQPRGASATLLGIIAERAGFAYEAVSSVADEATPPSVSVGPKDTAVPTEGHASIQSPVHTLPIGEDQPAESPASSASIGEGDPIESPAQITPTNEDRSAESTSYPTIGETASFESSAGCAPAGERANSDNPDGKT